MSAQQNLRVPYDIARSMARFPCAVMDARGVCNVGECHYNHEKKLFFCPDERSYGRCKSRVCKYKHERAADREPPKPAEPAPRPALKENRPIGEDGSNGVSLFGSGPPASASKGPSAGPPPHAPTAPYRGPPAAALAATAPVKAAAAEPATSSGPIQETANSISQDTLRDLSQIEPPRVGMRNGLPAKPRSAMPPPPSAPKSLTVVTAPEPVVNEKRERDLIMIFKAPLLSPLPLNEIERRNLLDTTLKMLGHPKGYMKRFAARVLSEPKPNSHLVDISNALLAGDEEEDACSLLLFQTRCIPFMKVLGHEYFDTGDEIQSTARTIINQVFPEPLQSMHLIVRTIACFHQNHALPENDGIDWADMYMTILRFLVGFAQRYKKIDEVTSTPIIVYWAILFLEEARDSWFPDQLSRDTVYDTIVQAVGLFKVDRYFAFKKERANLDTIRRLPCATLKKDGKCKEAEDDNCFFSHEFETITAKYVDRTNKRFPAMKQWLQLGIQNHVFSVADLRSYWDQALSFLDEGLEGFVLEALTLPEGRMHIGQILQLHIEETGELQFTQVESFLKLMSSHRLEDQTKVDGKVAEIAHYCVRASSFFSFWSDFVSAGLTADSSSQGPVNIAILMVGFARFVVNFNPIQSIEEPARKAMMTLCRIVAENNEEGTGPMSDAHDIAERLDFVIRRDLIMGTIDIIKRDRPNPEAVNDDSLVFMDDDGGVSVTTFGMDTEGSLRSKRPTGMPCNEFEEFLGNLKNALRQDSQSIPIFVSMMEAEGEFAILKLFFASEHEYNSPTEPTANIGIIPHCLPFLSILGRFIRNRDIEGDPVLRESIGELFLKMWPDNEFVGFISNTMNDFYHLHRDFNVLDERTKRKTRKGIEGMLRIMITLKKLHLLPEFDPDCEKLIMRFLRMTTDFHSAKWLNVQLLVDQVVKILHLQRHFVNVNMNNEALPPRLVFRYPKTFRCPERKVSRCPYPLNCQYDHVDEGLKTPSSISSNSDDEIVLPASGQQTAAHSSNDLIDLSDF
ncbi:hypothetical protein ABW21_db0208040 [Orbilia brochopaga]|nr:hypothetical protein ABW21_db0208040 [Drechslerella brochopaga]